MGVRTGDELADARPGGARTVPDPAERAGVREVAVPEVLRTRERERVSAGQPEVQRVRREDERREAEARERALSFRRRPAPGKYCQRRQQSDAGDPSQHCEPGNRPRAEPLPSLREQERAEGEREEERLAVDGLQEEAHREHREVEHRPPGAVDSEPPLGQPVEQQERDERGGQRDDDAGGDVVAAERTADAGERQRVERVEGRGGAVLDAAVAVLRDAQEPDGIPARPDVRDPAEVARQRRVVPAVGAWVPVRLEDQPGEERRGPDRRAAPGEDLECGPAAAADSQLGQAGTYTRLTDTLTRAHEHPIIVRCPSPSSPRRRPTPH